MRVQRRWVGVCAALVLCGCGDPTSADVAAAHAGDTTVTAADSAIDGLGSADATAVDAELSDTAADAGADVADAAAPGPDAGDDAASPEDTPVADATAPDTASAGDDAAAEDSVASDSAGADVGTDTAEPVDTEQDSGVADSGLSCGPSCDDGNPCTSDSCDSSTGACLHKKQPGLDCDDGEPCTLGDTCNSAGECLSGKWAATCLCKSDLDCLALEDKLICNGTLYCQMGGAKSACITNPATTVTCPPSGDPCLVAGCQEPASVGGSASCSLIPAVTGTPCDDGQTFTVGDFCKDGACQAGTDTAPCLQDDDCAKIDDQDLCNGTLFCNKAKAACQINPKTVVVCPTVDDTVCRQSTCQPKTGLCQLLPINNGKACDDGDSCTAGEACEAGVCKASAAANICGCKDDADCKKLEDGDACNGTLYCDKAAATCKINPATVVTCPSALDTDCTKNQCDKQSGACKPVWMPIGTPCDADSNACTPNDTCFKGVCEADVAVCECQVDADCAAKEDGNLCNGTLYCNKVTKLCQINPATVVSCPTVFDTDCTKNSCQAATGKCLPLPLPVGATCSDDNACTFGDACNGQGTCQSGSPFCDCLGDSDCPDLDKEPCNGIRFCDKAAAPYKCKDKPDSALPDLSPCDDGTVCTVKDACISGKCTGGAVGCDDKNPCTDDLCSPTGGCVNLANAVTCSDGDACTVGDLCGNGNCMTGSPLSCDDGLPCTADGCEAGVGCVHINTSDPCTDGSACTVGDVCDAGKCIPGKPADCADATVCTDDSCNPESGCQHLVNAKTCTDNDPCTVGDTCNGGVCISGAKLNCDDGEQCTKDACDVAKGACTHTNLTGACNDASLCTDADTCGSAGGKWTCVGTTKVCDDGNPCTDNSCDPKIGCKFANNAATAACYTGAAGTDGKGICHGGTKTCSGGAYGACNGQVVPATEVCDGKDNNCDGSVDNGVSCDDGNGCTIDACNGLSGCSHVAAPVPTFCGAGNVCTQGSCVPQVQNGVIFIPGGTYKIGCTPGDNGCNSDENPWHSVTVTNFYIMAAEVTVADYQVCVAKGWCTKPLVTGGCAPTTAYGPAVNWPATGPIRTLHPVNCVTQAQARNYCSSTIMGGLDWWDLPTEAEWEVAARAGNTTNKYVWGNTLPPPAGSTNLGDASAKLKYTTMPNVIANYDDTFAQTSPATYGTANAFGLFGMGGNVSEWVLDSYDAAYYGKLAAAGPNPIANGSGFVYRGGSWWCGQNCPGSIRVSQRYSTATDMVSAALGFRCAQNF